MGLMVKVGEVAPAIGLKVPRFLLSGAPPPDVSTLHCTAYKPVAAAEMALVKVADDPTVTVCGDGCVVKLAGRTNTVKRPASPSFW